MHACVHVCMYVFALYSKYIYTCIYKKTKHFMFDILKQDWTYWLYINTCEIYNNDDRYVFICALDM
jgi:hypothetical protein